MNSSIGGVVSNPSTNHSQKPTIAFAGAKASSSGSALAGTHTSSGQMGVATPGANDWSRFSIDGGGFSGVAGLALLIAQFGIALEQYNLAKKYYDTNLIDFDFFETNYGGAGGPLVTHKNQAFNTLFTGLSGAGGNPQTYTPDYEPMIAASLGRVKAYDEKWFQTRRRIGRYNVGLGRQIDYNFYMMRRRAAVTSWVSGRRMEDARKDMLDDQIQTHKVQALNFGITAGNVARQGLASATSTAMHAFDEMGSRVGGLSSGLGKYAGYKAGMESGQKTLASSSASGAAMAPHTVGRGT